MTLTLNLSESVEARLRERAAAIGQDAAEYAAGIVERAVTGVGADAPATPTQTPTGDQITDKVEQFLRRVNSLGPTSKPPPLKRLEAELEQALIENHR